MKKILIAIALASTSLTACLPNVESAPAPCSVTAVDERSLILGLQSFDTALAAINRLIAAKVIVPGSPRALQIADVIRDTKLAFQSASSAQRACNSTSYLIALDEARSAVSKLNTLVRG